MKKSSNRNRNVGRLKRIIPALVFLWLGLQPAVSQERNHQVAENLIEYRVPDFAFPKTVESRGDSLLAVYLKEGRETDALREAVNICLARSLSESDNVLQRNIEFLDSVTNLLHGCPKNLGYLLQAKILSDNYFNNSHKYDQRRLPLNGDWPQDPEEWNGEMFKDRIYALIGSATENSSSYSRKPMADISLLITDSQNATKTGLTVGDFILFKGAEILKPFVRDEQLSTIPFNPEQQKATLESRISERGKSLLNTIISNEKTNNPIVAATAVIRFLNYLPDSEREKRLSEAAEVLKGSEGEGIILYELWNRYPGDNNQYYEPINSWLSKFPSGYGNERLRYAISRMIQEQVEVELPSVAFPNEKIAVKTRVSNMDKVYLLVYKLNKDQYNGYDGFIQSKFKSSSKPQQIVEINGEGNKPFAFEKETEIAGMSPGLYVVIPSASSKLPKDWNNGHGSYSTIRITDIAIESSSSSNEKDSGRVYVVKGRDQQPVEGAKVTYYSGSNKKSAGKAVTNSEGWISIPSGYYRIEASYKDNEARSEAGFGYYEDRESEGRHLSILTDLSVYRPGDTIRFAVVGWKQAELENSLMPNEKIEVTLRDVNYRDAGKTTLQLNDEGRTEGELVIPSGRLLGSYILSASFEGSNKVSGSQSIQVEEYKLPSFLISVEQEESENPDEIKFLGTAKTYSGMPVSDSRVTVTVNYIPWRWGYMGTNANYMESAITDSQGKFEITLPLNNLKGTIFETGRYSITASATSEAGETETSNPCFFSLGKGFEIRPQISDKIKMEGNEVSLNVPVYNIAGLPEKMPVSYCFTNLNDSTQQVKGVFESPQLIVPFSSLTPGKYRLEFTMEEGAQPSVTETVFWKSDERTAPYPTPLWIPETEYSYAEGEKNVNITFGSYWPDWLLYIISDGKKILKTDWLHPDGLENLNVEIPSENSTLFINLLGMHDFKSQSGQIRIVPAKSLEKMEILTETFRDNLTAGDKETWKFKFNISGLGVDSANVFAVMSDKALNSISDFKWNLAFSRPGVFSRVHFSPCRSGNIINYRTFTETARYPNFTSLIPEWQTYGYSFEPVYIGFVQTRQAMAYKKAEGAVTMNAAQAPMPEIAEAVLESAADESFYDGAVAGIVSEDSAEEESGAGGNSDNKNSDLRPVEMPLAFFMTDLKTDSEGNVEVDFTVPNFNTTWQFQLAGYNDRLLSANLLLDAVSSKAVMVNTNLPQYLRSGDKATIAATLFNNSGEELPVEGKIEVFDVNTGEVLIAKNYASANLSPSGSRVISIEFKVPSNTGMLGCRAYAAGGGHKDGEQGYIPVWPSSTPVTEATTFYLGTNQVEKEILLPGLKSGSNVTLKYCDNPLWEVLLSMPSITERNSNNSLSIAEWLYGTLISSDIISKDRGIYDGLKNILASQDSTLSQSNLEKDQQLKITGLMETPWVNDAESETQRIRDLDKYLDKESVNSQVAEKIRALGELQRSDGGWSWFEGMSSSPYITQRIINILGYLNHYGLLDSQLSAQTAKAVNYYDKWLEKSYKKDKKLNILSTLDYLYSRRQTGVKQGNAIKNLEAACLDSIVSQWKYWEPGRKAKAALLMLGNDRYREEAITIANSLTQFLGKNLSLQEEALMLDLFNEAKLSQNDIEALSEKIYLQKETEDWGASVMNIDVINSLVRNASTRETDRSIPEIYIGKDKLVLPESQTLTGNFTINLNAKTTAGKKLIIKRQARLPAWGGVISQYVAPIKEVKKENVENLSIEKKVYIIDENGRAKESSSYKKGDRVRVTLTLSVGKDMDYIVLADNRTACLQPVDKVSGMVVNDGTVAYREFRTDKTSFFFENLAAGKYVFSYECHADREGEYSLGIAEVQSLYAPTQVAHSAGGVIKVNP